MTMDYSTFEEFVESEVLKISHQRRLDGWVGGPHGTAFARFKHKGRRWQINADSLVEPLIRAYEYDGDPFQIGVTKGGNRAALRLRSDLSKSSRIGIYIYEYPG